MVTLRNANSNDINTLQQLCIDTFAETYAAFNSPDDMRLFNETHFTTDQLQFEIMDQANYFFIAFAGDEMSGYVKMRTTKDPEALKGKRHIEIERIYVLQKFQKQKIGLQLINHCIETATMQGYEVIWLGVWQKNDKAIQFYTRRGFVIFDTHIFTLGKDPQQDWLMKMELGKVQ